MNQRDTFTVFVEEIAMALAPLQVAISSPDRFVSFMAELGWRVDAVPQPLQDLAGGLATLITELQHILTQEGAGAEISLADIDHVRQAVQDVFGGIKAISGTPDAAFPPSLIDDNFKLEFPSQLVQFLVIKHLTQHRPQMAFVLRALGVVRINYVPATGHRRQYMRYRFDFSDLPNLLADPGQIFTNAYGWGTDDLDYETLFHHLENLLLSLQVDVARPILRQETANLLAGGIELPGQPERRPVAAVFFERMRKTGRLAAELLFLDLPGDDTVKPGLAILPRFNGPLDFRLQLGTNIAVTISNSLDVQGGIGLILRPGRGVDVLVGFENGSAPTSAQGTISVRAEYSDENQQPIMLLGSPEATRLEFKNVSGTAGLLLDAKNESQNLFVELELQGGKLVVAPGQGDGFLQAILPQDEIGVVFELVVGLSISQGFYFKGSGGLEINIPTRLSLGPVEFQSLTIGSQPKNGSIPINLGATAKAVLGPVTAVVENMGLRATFSFPDEGANIGPLDLDVGFKPPDGLGLSVDGGGFTGGGFLRYIESDQRYEGMLELEYEDRISLKAIGLLTTRLPGGQPGFSLLIIITAEFNPIQLGLGFTLNGVGGLLGLNRTADAERLRSGLRDNTLSSVLFPQNLVENASRILSDLNQLFPAQANRFIFGPMARIGWGSPTLITIDLGLLVEIPDPVRVLILGVIRALLPDEKARLLQLQVNFLGVIDFAAQRLSFDASLYDSKLLSFTLAGDMAVRLCWGAEPNFLLTVGGFHPAYQPPPLNLPTLRRLSLQLTAGDNPRLTLETYFAITSNTVQFGARVELLAKAGSFSVYGFLSFDVLFQFNPFYFIASISAKLALRAGGSEIASISLDLTLEGPTPWHVKGTARLKICWFLTIKVRFDKTFGELLTILLPDIALLPLLRAALADPGNWEAQPARGRPLLVSFKEIEAFGGQVVAVPFGVLTIQQKVVPLGIDIQRFGSQRPADGNRFAIEKVTVGEESEVEELSTSAVSEQFAPAEFFELTDAQKLSSKSFERYDSGVQLVDSEAFNGEYAVRREVVYELCYIDEQRDLVPQGKPLRPDFLTFHSWAVQGAVAASPLSQARNGKSALAPGAVQVSQEGYAVVRASDLRPVAAEARVASEAGAQRLMDGLLRENPALDSEILVVPAFEVNHS